MRDACTMMWEKNATRVFYYEGTPCLPFWGPAPMASGDILGGQGETIYFSKRSPPTPVTWASVFPDGRVPGKFPGGYWSPARGRGPQFQKILPGSISPRSSCLWFLVAPPAVTPLWLRFLLAPPTAPCGCGFVPGFPLLSEPLGGGVAKNIRLNSIRRMRRVVGVGKWIARIRLTPKQPKL